jgi:hypothetical protein
MRRFRPLLFATGFGSGLVVSFLVAEIFAKRATITGGDWMSFAGALAGSVITVAGALVVVQLQEHVSNRTNQNLLYDLLVEVMNAARAVQNPPSDERFSPAVMQRSGLETLDAKITQVQEALQWIRPNSAAMVRVFTFTKRMRLSETAAQRAHASWFYDQAADLSADLEPVAAMARAAMRELVN